MIINIKRTLINCISIKIRQSFFEIFRHATENGSWDKYLEDRGEQKWQHTKSYANSMLIHCKRDCSHRISTKLNTRKLDEESEDQDNQKERVVKKVFEYVNL
jgi:hypothetical protein